MKAEHRKQLEQNELASRLATWWKGTGGGASATTLWIVLGVSALLLIIYLLWNMYSDSTTKTRSAQWYEFDQAAANSQLEAIFDAHKGSPPALAARVMLARGKLQDGLTKLASDYSRKEGVDLITAARDQYEQVAKNADDGSELQREARLSLAKIEEALAGVVKGDNPGETLGTLDRAAQLYQEVVDRHKDSIQATEAGERLKDLKENRAKVAAFYEELAKHYIRTPPDLKIPDPKAPAVPKQPAPTQPATTAPITPVAPTPTAPAITAPPTTPKSTAPAIEPVDPKKPTAAQPTTPAAPAPKTEPARTQPAKTEPAKTEPAKK